MARPAQAANIDITTNTNWSAISTGTGTGGQPGSGDTIVVKNGATLTVDVSNGLASTITLGSDNAPGKGNGTLTFNSGSQVTVSSTVTLGDVNARAATITMTSGGTLITNGFVVTAGGGTVTLTPGTGTIQLMATNTLPTAFTTFNNLVIFGGTTTLAANVNSTAAGTLTVKAGATLALGGNTYGATTAPTSVTLEGGATTGASITGTAGTGVLTLGGNVTVNSAGTGTSGATVSCPVALTNATTRTFTVADDGTSATDLTVSGIISTSGSLTKAGAGTMVLSAANTYSGTTTISNGILQLGNGGTTGSLSTSSAITNNGNFAINRSNAVAQGTDFVTGAITGSGSLTKAGAGTLTLNAANTYSGGTTLNVGTLDVQNDSGVGTGTLTINGGTIQSSNAARSLSNAVAIGGDFTVGSINSIHLSGATSLNSGTRTITVTNGSMDFFLDGSISSGGLIKAGAGRSAFTSGASTYSGGVTVNAGSVTLGASSTPTTGTPTSGPLGIGGLTMNGGTIAASTSTRTLANSVTVGGDFTIGITGTATASLVLNGAMGLGAATRTVTIDSAIGAATFGGVISNGGLTKAGTGTLILSGANTYGSDTTVNAGTLKLGASGVIPDGSGKGNVNLNSASVTLDLGGFSEAINGLSGNGTVDNSVAGGPFVLTVGGNDQTSTYSGVMKNTAGTLGLTKTGTGTLILGATNTYTGVTTINDGVLRVSSINNGGVAGNLGQATNAASNLVLGGGTLRYVGSTASTDRAFTLTAATNSSIEIEVTAANLTMSGASASTSGALTKIGTGTLTLSGANSYTGGTTLSAGTLNINNSSALGTAAGTFTINGGTTINCTSAGGINTVNYPQAWNGDFTFTGSNDLNLGTGAVTLSANRQVTTNGGTLTVGGTISAASLNLTKAGSGTLSFGGQTVTLNNLTINGGTLNQGAGANVSSAGTLTVASGATYTNLGTGDLIVGTGGVANAGAITFNANGGSCGDPDDIMIRSSSTGVARTWTGAGTFSMTDVDVQDQTAGVPPTTIFVTSGTNSGNNSGWTFIGTCTSGTYVWTGSISSDWQVPANWSPIRTVPSTADVLVFDGNATPSPTVTNVPTETDAALRLTNSINGVTVNANTVGGAKTLTLSGATGTDLSIGSGSILTVAGSTALQISVASGSTGTISGGMIVQGAAHRLLGNAASAITFQSGGFFTTSTSFSGNAFGTATAGSVIFASGSTYFHNAGSSPFGTVGGSAVCVFQTGGEAQYLTAGGFDANGRTYANLVIGKVDPGGVAVAATDSGSGNFQFDNLTVASPASSQSTLSYTGSGSSTITIQGNITSTGNGNGGTVEDIMLTAPGGIQIKVPGAGGSVTFQNSSGAPAHAIKFESDATVDANTTLNLGRKLQMGATADKVLTANGTINPNVSAPGYVLGAVKKPSLPASFTFPVGTIFGYTPVELANAAGGGTLTVMPVDAVKSPLSSSTTLSEYWTLTLNSGALTSDLKFTYLDSDINGNDSDYRIIVVESGNATSFPNNCPSGDACVDFANNKATVKQISSFSDWTLGAPLAPTAVKLRNFNAIQNESGEVTLRWQTGHEVHNLGYNVYREQDGQRTRITPALVAGSALIAGGNTVMTAGANYTWYDEITKSANVTYWLEDVDLDGTVTLHGPIAPALKYGSKGTDNALSGTGRASSGTDGEDEHTQRSPLLSEVSKRGGSTLLREWPAAFAHQQASLERPQVGRPAAPMTQPPTSGSAGIKIAVSRSGWQRITQPELVAAGLDSGMNAQKLQLYANGSPVPIKISGNGISLTSADYIEFYGHGLDSPTDVAQTYYLVLGKGNGSRVSDVKKSQALPPPSGPSSFDYTIERRDRFIYYAALLNGDKENIFGRIVAGSPVDETLTVNHRDTGAAASGVEAHLEVSLVGVSLGSHHVNVSINGVDLGAVDFNAGENPTNTFALPSSALVNGDNTVRLVAVNTERDVSLVESVRLTYPHGYVADNNSLAISVSSPTTTRVSGFTNASIRVVDITNQSSVIELTSAVVVRQQSDGSYSADIQVPNASTSNPHTLLVFLAAQALHPDRVERDEPSSWSTQTAGFDYLIITNRDFKSQVEPLAQLRRNQGLVVAVVDVEDLYDEFTFGMHSPQAVRDFLAAANSNWKRKPRFVLLAGDASYDPKNYLGQGFTDFIPTRLFDSALMETATDDWLADFDGDGIADLQIGRLPIRTVADADLMVNKIISYEAMPVDSQRSVTLVADYGFESSSAALEALVPTGVPLQLINRSSGDDGSIHTQIINSVNQGPRLVNYLGHGSFGVWTGTPILSTDDAPSLTNTNRLSVFVMMTCLNSYFQNAYDESLSEALMRSPAGAVAVWGSSGMTEPSSQDQIDQEFYRQVFNGQTVGSAILNAKKATQDKDVRRTWILLGDPSMRVK